jgi:hypothetical protein
MPNDKKKRSAKKEITAAVIGIPALYLAASTQAFHRASNDQRGAVLAAIVAAIVIVVWSVAASLKSKKAARRPSGWSVR